MGSTVIRGKRSLHGESLNERMAHSINAGGAMSGENLACEASRCVGYGGRDRGRALGVECAHG